MQNFNLSRLPEGQKQEFINQLKSIRSSLPNPPQFSSSERKIIQTMSEIRKPFVDKSFIYGEKDPSVLPPYVNIGELRMDLDSFSDYHEIMKEYDLLGRKLKDLLIASGADCFYTALSIYNSFKMAAKNGISEAKTAVDDLKILFDKQAPTTEDPGQ